jgi:hypothetical protein
MAYTWAKPLHFLYILRAPVYAQYGACHNKTLCQLGFYLLASHFEVTAFAKHFPDYSNAVCSFRFRDGGLEKQLRLCAAGRKARVFTSLPSNFSFNITAAS